MAVIRCPNCGKENPDSLDVCQFCQAPLSTGLRIGDKPTKKNTGELEPVLPDWLRDMRQQARDSAEKDAAEAAAMPKIQKEQPPDFLAGLASQSTKEDDEELPSWLSGLAPKQEEKSSSSRAAKPTSNFFSQFEQPAAGTKNESKPAERAESVNAGAERDELSDWFAKASEEPSEPFAAEPESAGQEMDWGSKGDASPASAGEEDLSWLRNLEAESKKTGELSQSRPEDHWSSEIKVPAGTGPSSSQEDLSWLDSLGSLPASEQPGQAPSGREEDLNWLNAFGETAAPQAPATPPASQEDMSWLDQLGALPPTEPASPAPSQPGEDLGWLSAFAGTQAVSQQKDEGSPEQKGTGSEEDLSWLRDLQGTPGSFSGALSDTALEQDRPDEAAQTDNIPHISPFTPRQTAPLDNKVEPELPDWLKSATEEPSMPLGAEALDRMREEPRLPPMPDENVSRALFGTVMAAHDEQPTPPPAEPETAANQEAGPLFEEVNSLFSDELPDWLSNPEPADKQAVEEIGIHAEGGEALSPAELPSWVQAMRPVEAVIAAEALTGADNLAAEREGPLAGLRGVIPAVALGSLRRPRPIPLTLQTSEGQQANVALLEQILQDETTPRSQAAAPAVTSQQTLRWIIAGLLLFVLGAVLFSGTQIMPISPVLPAEARDMTNVVMGMADNAPVLVIMDYQPGLAGEMEAVSGPLLDQLVRLHRPYLTFVATSPGGNALVERLLANTNINEPGDVGYVAGQNYTNLGYLPGGESGVLAFIQSPQTAIPASPVLSFSEYAAVLLLTDHADSARTWVEQLSIMKQADPTLASLPLLTVASAQTGPMLRPYFSSGQITGMISGLPTAAGYESLNDHRPGMARTYWDAFGVGMMMAVFLIVLGSLWSVYSGVRARRTGVAEE